MDFFFTFLVVESLDMRVPSSVLIEIGYRDFPR
jgi:hypothetical protein